MCHLQHGFPRGLIVHVHVRTKHMPNKLYNEKWRYSVCLQTSSSHAPFYFDAVARLTWRSPIQNDMNE